MDFSYLPYLLLYAAVAGIGGSLIYVLMGPKIRGWLHRAPVQLK